MPAFYNAEVEMSFHTQLLNHCMQLLIVFIDSPLPWFNKYSMTLQNDQRASLVDIALRLWKMYIQSLLPEVLMHFSVSISFWKKTKI